MTLYPADEGWRMPAEWERHEATWIAWPHQVEDWPGKFEPIPWVYAEIVRQLHVSELVYIVGDDAKVESTARRCLAAAQVDLSRCRFFQWPTDRSSIRDYGPIFLVDTKGQVALTDWGFNAWAKYSNWHSDNRVPMKIAQTLALKAWPVGVPPSGGSRSSPPKGGTPTVVLEGGSIDVNGAGLLLTTEECLLSDVQARNPGLGREDLELVFARYLGIQKVLWLNRGITGDDTHGHVDDIARFVAPGTIVAAVEPDPGEENFEPLRENLERLRGMTDITGQALDIVEIPMPAPVFFDGQRLPASYANFYIANDRVLVPTFNDPQDRHALNTLAELFPSRAVVGIHAVDLVLGLGTLHCLTQQQPIQGRWA